MDQNKTPLIDALASFTARNRAYFNIPGHRGAAGVDDGLCKLLGSSVFAADRTETDGLDDLHAPAGAILEAQALAAELFGSDHCWFLVNGTTCANEAMILSAVRPGEEILVPRNAHKSVLMGLVQSGAVPVWVMPEQESGTRGLYGAVTPQAIARALAAHPGIRAVFLVSPTYYGSCARLTEIASLAHAEGIPLLVDEAHGAHVYFHEALPQGAITAGADLIAQSTHKTLGSLTQSAMLHLTGRLIDRQRVEDNLKLVQSTSPSYPLMASLDGTRHLMAMRGRELQAHAMKLAAMLRGGLAEVAGLEVYHRPEESGGSVDPCRIVCSARETGLTGIALQQALFARGITTELADPDYLVAVVTHGNTEAEVFELTGAVREILRDRRAVRKQRQSAEHLVIPPMVLSPRDAWFAERETVSLTAACGRIAGEMIAPYPPGIPLVYPGERLTPEICAILAACRAEALPVHGPADPTLMTLRVIK